MSVISGFTSLPDTVRVWSVNSPNKAALVDAQHVTTYAQLHERSNHIANTLLAAGVRPGSHIGFLGKNSAALFEIWLGINKAGCALTPLNWRNAPAELVEVVRDAQVPLIFTGADCTHLAEEVRRTAGIAVDVVAEDEVNDWSSRAGSSDPGIALHGTDTALLAYTSGTTAAPKGVPISHGALMNWFAAAASEPSVDWKSDDIGLMVMPNFHLAGTLVSLPALCAGASLAILPAFDPAAFVAAVAAIRPTVSCLVPTAMQMLLDYASTNPADFSSLRRLLYAGSPIGQHTLKKAIDVFGCDLVQFYGTTETFIITLLRPDQHRLQDPGLLKSCGKPMPGVELRLVDPAGRNVASGETGEILVRSPWMFSGYFNKPDATAAAISDGWYRTGDAGMRDDDGNLCLVDRIKDMIVSGGENIYSAEVERALAAHPDVQSVAVIGAPDDRWGERVVAFVVPRAGTTIEISDLMSHCRALIAGYKVPKEIFITGELPHTASGKVQKVALRQQLQQRARLPERER